MKKRLLAILLTLALTAVAMPAVSFAADTSLDNKAVYYTPASDYKSGDCILTATKMMIRRGSIIRKCGDWSRITNKALRSPATICGLLLNSFKVDQEGLVYQVDSGMFKGKGDEARIREFEALLRAHPEGIVVHGDKAASTGPHGVLVVAVKNGVVYAADSSRNTGLNNKGIQEWKDTTMLAPSRVTKYWYISGVSVSSKTSPSTGAAAEEPSTLRISSVKAPAKIKKGKGYRIKGKVRSNKKIVKVTVKVLDSNGSKVYSASKKPNAKSFNISKLDSKIKFGRLKKGSYTFQVIATDKQQTLTLVNKGFRIK